MCAAECFLFLFFYFSIFLFFFLWSSETRPGISRSIDSPRESSTAITAPEGGNENREGESFIRLREGGLRWFQQLAPIAETGTGGEF